MTAVDPATDLAPLVGVPIVITALVDGRLVRFPPVVADELVHGAEADCDHYGGRDGVCGRVVSYHSGGRWKVGYSFHTWAYDRLNITPTRLEP